MARSANKVASRNRRRKFLKLAKGYWGSRKNVWTVAKNHIEKGLQHAYVGRKLKKRSYRSLWIMRINAAAREHGTTYSRLIHALKANNININRKVLADFAMNKPEVFKIILGQVNS
jgi:large subunit ribosomal protein L20